MIKNENAAISSSLSSKLCLHLICALGIVLAFWVSYNFFSIDLVSDPCRTLLLIWVIEGPPVVLLYSWFRQDADKCSYWKAVGRGILGITVGAVVNALGAIALGAPVGIQYFEKTVHWSLMMSVLTFVPAASVFGVSWSDWQRIFAHTKPVTCIDYMICLPAHGAVIGAWLGAWPMPLDWERPWQKKVDSPILASPTADPTALGKKISQGMAYLCNLWSPVWVFGGIGGILLPSAFGGPNPTCERRLTHRDAAHVGALPS